MTRKEFFKKLCTIEVTKIFNQQDLKNKLKRDSFTGRFEDKYIIPMLMAFDKFIGLNVNPNYITLFNSVFILTGFICIHYRQYILTGVVLIISLWLDGYDGVLARRLKKVSLAGSIFDLINDKFRDLVIGIIIYLTTDNSLIKIIGLLYGPITIIYSYIRSLMFQNKICTRLISFGVGLRYIVIFMGYFALQIKNDLRIFGIILSINIIIPFCIFIFYYLTLFKKTLLNFDSSKNEQ